MALGFKYSSNGGGENIVPFIKYNARAGRISRTDRVEEAGNFTNLETDITDNFRAVFDFENMEVGWMRFSAGVAPEFVLAKFGEKMPDEPAGDNWRQGVRLMLKLAQECGGDVRELAGNSAAF